MSRGFILLEAVIAILIISMTSIIALEAMQTMGASITRFRTSTEVVAVRRNALAVVRHRGRAASAKQGVLAYEPYEVRWQSREMTSVSISQQTLIGNMPPQIYPVERLTVTTFRDGRMIDQFEMIGTVVPTAR